MNLGLKLDINKEIETNRQKKKKKKVMRLNLSEAKFMRPFVF